MSNVIRPTFGSRPREAEPALAEYRPPHLYGNAADYLVALMVDGSGPEGEVLKVVVGPIGHIEVEAVATMPATPEGRADADATALAILRTLEIIETANAATAAQHEFFAKVGSSCRSNSRRGSRKRAGSRIVSTALCHRARMPSKKQRRREKRIEQVPRR